MSPTQHALLQSYQEALVQLKQTNFQKRLEQAVKEADDEVYTYKFETVCHEVVLLPFLSLLVATYKKYCFSSKSCCGSVWKHHKQSRERFVEQLVYSITLLFNTITLAASQN